MKNGKLFVDIMICAALLTGCGGRGQAEISVTETVSETSVTESITESLPETSATASTTESVSETSVTEGSETEKSHPFMQHLMAFKTSQYLDENEYGKVKIIRSREELEEFGEFCEKPKEVAEYGSNVDFNKNAVAVNTIFLPSGSYDFDFYETSASDGIVNFVYELIDSDAMTDDIATLYMLGEIPSDRISDPYPGENVQKYNDNILAFKTNAVSDFDMYKTSIIRSSGELAEFGQAYGVSDKIADFGDSVDFDENVIAVNVMCLASGEYKYIFNGVNAGGGHIIFDYSRIGRRDAMTCDEAALFMLAEIPAEAVS